MEDKLKLNAGSDIPAVGLGTWNLVDGPETESVIRQAIKLGYRLIDSAKLYANEKSVGRAIRAGAVDRSNIFVTTKLWNSDQGYHTARAAFEASLNRLGLDYVDLYLIHSPATGQRLNAWRALEEIFEAGQARAIGVSNYQPRHLQEILSTGQVVPAVNQIEFHPLVYRRQQPTIEFCSSHGIAVEAYSPLGEGRYLDHPVLAEMAARHHKTPAQVMLRWAVQHRTVPIPKSRQPARLAENIDIFRFELSAPEMDQLNNLKH